MIKQTINFWGKGQEMHHAAVISGVSLLSYNVICEPVVPVGYRYVVQNIDFSTALFIFKYPHFKS